MTSMVGSINTNNNKPLVLLLLNSASDALPPLLPLPSRHFNADVRSHESSLKESMPTALPPLQVPAYQPPLQGYQYFMPHQVPLRAGLISEPSHGSLLMAQVPSHASEPKHSSEGPLIPEKRSHEQSNFVPTIMHSPQIRYSGPPPPAPYVMMAPVPMASMGHATPMIPHGQAPHGIPIAGGPLHAQHHQHPHHIYHQMPPAVMAPGMAGDMGTAPSLPNKHRRFRRRYYQIVRKYKCTHPGCTKSYGSLNHLNTHIVTKKHGARKSKADFKDQEHMGHKQSHGSSQEESEGAHNDYNESFEKQPQPPTPPSSDPSYERFQSNGAPQDVKPEHREVSSAPALPTPMTSSATLPKITNLNEDQVRLPSLPAIVGQFQS